jgi:hypothetical protein
LHYCKPDPAGSLIASLTQQVLSGSLDEWLDFLKHVNPWYQPVAELMMLTGCVK